MAYSPPLGNQRGTDHRGRRFGGQDDVLKNQPERDPDQRSSQSPDATIRQDVPSAVGLLHAGRNLA